MNTDLPSQAESFMRHRQNTTTTKGDMGKPWEMIN